MRPRWLRSRRARIIQRQPVIILGHYAQILNFLLRAHQRSVAVQGQDLPKTVYEQFKYLLEGSFIDPTTGGLGNGYI